MQHLPPSKVRRCHLLVRPTSTISREIGRYARSKEPYPLTIDAKSALTDADYRVEKMKFAQKGDKSTVIYNGKITVKNIPAEAWDYVVNGKAALDWVMERQSVKTDKASGIVNNANDWAIETVHNPKCTLELFQHVVTVSLETQKNRCPTAQAGHLTHHLCCSHHQRQHVK